MGLTGLNFTGNGAPLTVLDTGPPALVNAASATATVSSLLSGGPELPFFTDGSSLYTGAITANGLQSLGLAGRITVNSALVGNSSKLVQFALSTAAGDTTRPNFILNQLTAGTSLYPPETGFGTTAAPFQSTLLNFTQQLIAAQGTSAARAQQVASGQKVVLSTLQAKLNDTAGVNVDDQIAHLVSVQNIFAANARVLSAANDLLTKLLNSI